MKNYYVIGNPIEHSISPKIHNYWFKENGVEAKYEKQSLLENQLEDFIKKLRDRNINGINVTVPFKEKVIPFMDSLTHEAKKANSVNTIFLSDNNLIGHNTDISGFYTSLVKDSSKFEKSSALILGSGGVAPSIIIGLSKLGFKKIFLSNRTKEKALKLKEKFKFVEIIDWGETIKTNIVINATSIGLNKFDEIKLNYKLFGIGNYFFDVIYNPKKTNFLKNAEKQGCFIQNGMMMFVNQAADSFETWHRIKPNIDDNLIKFLQND